MMFKSVLASKPAMALAAVLALGSLSLGTDAFAKGGGRGGGHVGGGYVGGGSGLRSGAAVRSGTLTARPSFAVRGVNRGVAFHRPFVRHRFIHRGFRTYPYYSYGCYRWRRVLTPFGWRLRRVNVCYPYYRQYYY